MKSWRWFTVNCILLLTLLGASAGRRLDDATVTPAGFLHNQNLPYRDWKVQDRSLSPSEERLLQPDDAVIRRYTSPRGEIAELAVIAGHRKQSIHTPGFCMVGDGWEMIEQHNGQLQAAGRSISTVHAVMARDGGRILVIYFFTDGEYCTNSLLRFQGVQVFKRLRADTPVGALVRIIVPYGGDMANVEHGAAEFANAILPPILAALRTATVHPI